MHDVMISRSLLRPVNIQPFGNHTHFRLRIGIASQKIRSTHLQCASARHCHPANFPEEDNRRIGYLTEVSALTNEDMNSEFSCMLERSME